jgi:hypothetical protein
MARIDVEKLKYPTDPLEPHIFRSVRIMDDQSVSMYCDVCSTLAVDQRHIEGKRLREKANRQSARIISQMDSIQRGKSIAVPKVTLVCFWSAFLINVIYHNFIR